MSRLNCCSGSRRRAALAAAFALAAAGLFSGAAAAGPRQPVKPLFKLDLTWTASLMPVPAAPLDAPEPAPLVTFDDVPNQLRSQVSTSPGLQFSLDPDNEEVFLGWQFGF